MTSETHTQDDPVQGPIALDLAGVWQFALDREDVGIAQEWHQRDLPDTIALPGSLQAQGYGDDVTAETAWVGSVFDDDWYVQERYAPYRVPGNLKVPFWLQPAKRYQGAAWYRHVFEVPAAWKDNYLTLTLERPHWGTRVWVDGRDLGDDDTLSAPHIYALGKLGAGRHVLTIRVDNRMLYNVGPNAHSVSDHTQTAWNGIVGRLEVTAHDAIQIAAVDVTPAVEERSFHLRLIVRNRSATAQASTRRRSLPGRLTLRAELVNVEGTHGVEIVEDVRIRGGEMVLHIGLPLGEEAHLWSEFHPALYTITATLEVATNRRVQYSEARCTTGLRAITTEGRHILLNGRRIFLRGTLECCIFPRTGYPATDVDAWRRILRICKDHGLNHMRFHSWCPPEAAFQAGDELGVYFQVECAAWVNQGPGVGLGDPVDVWLYHEAERILAAYGHHPCFVMMAHGNEPGGNQVVYLREWVDYWKQRDPVRLYTSGAGWPEIPENDYHNLPDARIQQWGAELRSRINADPPETCTTYAERIQASSAPIVSHEVGQWCVYPNFEEMAKYDGYLRARNFEIFRDFLEAHHMGDQAHDFLMASGKLQVLCYKEEIEALLRTPDLGGFQLLDLHDFPGQGTALVGVLDPFWDAKPYVSSAEFRRFCGAIVPLASLPKRYWRSSETFVADVQIAHWGADALEDVQVSWRVANLAGATVAAGAFPAATLHPGGLHMVGRIEVTLQHLPAANKYTLFVAIASTEIENDWDFWLFADELDIDPPDGIHVATKLDDMAIASLRQGGKVLLALPPDRVRTEAQIGFSSVFWNTSWTKAHGESGSWPRGQAPHTLGILCDPSHPLFKDFPTEYHSNWQWWELIHDSAAMVLEELPPQVRPLVQPIDTWFESRRLGLLVEAQVEGGCLMICSMDVASSLDTRLVARQMRHAILRYMASDSFAPQQVLALQQAQRLYRA